MHDILAVADDCRSWPANLKYAAELAVILRGTLTGLYIAPAPVTLPDVDSPSLLSEVIDMTREQTDAAYRAEAAFKSWAAELGVRSSAWYVTKTSIDSALSRVADWHDLIVLGRETQTPWESVGDVGRTLLTVGLPCVLVPRKFDRAASVKTVAVAWNGSPESLRALHAALPLLRLAERIVLIRRLNPHTFPGADWTPNVDIEKYLEWQGLRATSLVIADDDPSAVLKAARGAAADLLVMGAYGRGRFSEWIFGGATRYALEHAHIPLLMRH